MEIRNRFACVPEAVVRDRTLTGNEIKVMLALYLHRNGDSLECNPKSKTIAAVIGMSPESVRRAMAGLRSKGWIETKQTGRAPLITINETAQPPEKDQQKTQRKRIRTRRQTQEEVLTAGNIRCNAEVTAGVTPGEHLNDATVQPDDHSSCNPTATAGATPPSQSYNRLLEQTSLTKNIPSGYIKSGSGEDASGPTTPASDGDRVDKQSSKNASARAIIDHLNLIAGTGYRYAQSDIKHINARLKEGFSEEDLKLVAEFKSQEWLGTEFGAYLRCSTLFAGKCNGYYGQAKRWDDAGRPGTAAPGAFGGPGSEAQRAHPQGGPGCAQYQQSYSAPAYRETAAERGARIRAYHEESIRRREAEEQALDGQCAVVG